MNKYDVNNDGRVTECDAQIVQKYLAELFECPALDVNEDGMVDFSDYEKWAEEFKNISSSYVDVQTYDMNKDGKLNETDIKIIQEAILKMRRKTSSMDLDDNWKVDMSDVMLLRNVLNRKKLDINNSGRITASDGKILLRIIEKFERFIENMDVNKDGDINMHDVTDIQQNKD